MSIVPLKIYEILEKAVNGNIENFEVNVQDPNKKGEGFLGQIFFVSLRDKYTGKQLHFVVKQAFSEQNIRDMHPIRDVFVTEIYFYKKLWPKLLKFQEKVSPANRFVHLAKCFATASEENCERLLLENLKYQGFVMHDKKKALEKEQFEFIFKVYGKLHAISFAYKALDPESLLELVEGVTDVWIVMSHKSHFHDAVKIIHEESLEYLEPSVEGAIIKKYKHYVDDGLDLLLKSLAKGKYTAITHGDCWSNNMMFKYDNSGETVDVRFLDFQMFRVGSPVCDLSYCLYSGGTKEVFDDLDHLLHVYHDSLSESLREYGCDPMELYPLEALKNDWKVHCQFGAAMGLMLWRAKLTYDNDVMDLSDMCEDEEGVKKFFQANCDENTFKERVRDIVTHLYENNYII
ncbi:uncharacterized protein LOC108907576 [Anoplophora glabripennis]|nr:uncharacterized protein LOC108907576 [Anoplophora glabripennis]